MSETTAPAIARHTPAQAALHTVGTGGYLALKWTLAPGFYVARRAGWKGTWPRRFDARCGLAVMPLTEGPDDALRCDLAPAIRAGDAIPDVAVRFADGTSRSLRAFAGRPLLLVLVRGSWCPYSRLHLADLNAALPGLEAANIRVLAVSSYSDADWWRGHGVRVPFAFDPEGALFTALGLRVEHFMETAWGRVLPHESAFLFDASGRFLVADVRRVSGYRTKQSFLSGGQWLRIARTRIRGDS
jgi:peroxiredoxin